MNTTLDEWEILQAVVQLRGFAPAAQHLHRSQSTISYAITRLQDRLGIKLLELKGRKAQLTEAGRVLLADAEPHLAGFHQLEQRARSLASGGESEIRLSVDSIFPNDRLFATLFEFTQRFPYVHPKLHQATFLSSETEFSAHGAHLCIAALISREYYADTRHQGARSCPAKSPPSRYSAAGVSDRPNSAHGRDHRRSSWWGSQATATQSRATLSVCYYDRGCN
jgi:DNA-binding transcriptional LysR family regulator